MGDWCRDDTGKMVEEKQGWMVRSRCCMLKNLKLTELLNSIENHGV